VEGLFSSGHSFIWKDWIIDEKFLSGYTEFLDNLIREGSFSISSNLDFRIQALLKLKSNKPYEKYGIIKSIKFFEEVFVKYLYIKDKYSFESIEKQLCLLRAYHHLKIQVFINKINEFVHNEVSQNVATSIMEAEQVNVSGNGNFIERLNSISGNNDKNENASFTPDIEPLDLSFSRSVRKGQVFKGSSSGSSLNRRKSRRLQMREELNDDKRNINESPAIMSAKGLPDVQVLLDKSLIISSLLDSSKKEVSNNDGKDVYSSNEGKDPPIPTAEKRDLEKATEKVKNKKLTTESESSVISLEQPSKRRRKSRPKSWTAKVSGEDKLGCENSTSSLENESSEVRSDENVTTFSLCGDNLFDELDTTSKALKDDVDLSSLHPALK